MMCTLLKSALVRAAGGKTKTLGSGPLSRIDAWRMVRRRAKDAGVETAIGCHTFRATGLTDYLTNGGRIKVAQRMAGHSNAKITGLFITRAMNPVKYVREKEFCELSNSAATI